MTLRARLTLGLLTIVVLLALPLLISIRSLEQLHRDAQALREGEFAASLLLGNMRESLNEVRRLETALLFVHDVSTRDAMAKEVTRMTLLTDSLTHYGLARPARDLGGALKEIANWVTPEYLAAIADQRDRADSISADHLVPALGRAEMGILVAERELRERTRVRVEHSAAALSSAEQVAIVALVLALALCALTAAWLVRTISRPVSRLEDGMQAISEGDLTWRLPDLATRPDAFGTLARSFETMTKQLQELDKLKAEFVSIASHELKTPINVVLGYVQLLNEAMYGSLSDKQTQVLQTVESQMQSLSRLVKQLLDVSRFEAGGGKLEPRAFDLRVFLEDLHRAFGVLAVQRGVDLRLSLGDGLPDQVVWDHDRMSEVLGNLLTNAFKFTARGGEVELSVEPAGEGVQIEVRDTGAGIPTEQLPHVFEKFYQASNQPTRSAGSGLGLAIVKQIVEAHNGAIQCESTPGVGTTFTITMPTQVAGRRPSVIRPTPAGV